MEESTVPAQYLLCSYVVLFHHVKHFTVEGELKVNITVWHSTVHGCLALGVNNVQLGTSGQQQHHRISVVLAGSNVPGKGEYRTCHMQCRERLLMLTSYHL